MSEVKKVLSLADLGDFQINEEKAQQVAQTVLAPTRSCYVALVGFEISDPDPKSGDRTGEMHLAEIDLAQTYRQRKAVPLEGSGFKMRQMQFVMSGGKDKDGKPLSDEELKKARENDANRTGAFIGSALRSAGIKVVDATQTRAAFVDAVNNGPHPVGIFNPGTNGPELQEPYTKDGKVLFAKKKDYPEVTFPMVDPDRLMEHIGGAVTLLEANNAKLVAQKAPALPIDHTAIKAVLTMKDVREYAKVAEKQAKNRTLPPGGDGGGEGFGGGMGSAPPDRD